MKLRSIAFLSTVMMVVGVGISNAAPASKPVEIYSLKIYNAFDAKAKKQCANLAEAKMRACLDKLIMADPNPVVLKRTILVDSGAKVLSSTARAIMRDAQALGAVNGGNPTTKELETALSQAPLGVVIGSFDKKSQSIKLAIPLSEAGKVVLVQSATISISKGVPVLNGTDLFGRRY
mgnify:CR=1 FL=1